MHIVMISDWFHTTTLDKFTALITWDVYGLIPENIVINLKGVR